MHPVLDQALNAAPVMPVLVVPTYEMAVPLATALAAGGLTVFEVTLRTSCAFDAMRLMKEAVPGSLIGAGTVLDAEAAEAAKAAGADFAVSPGTTDALWRACEAIDLPLLPGFSTASEAMRLMERGSQCGKFFPAEAAGGVSFLKSLAGPLPDFQVCPTGGIRLETAPDYLACPNVVCVGGSWIATADSLQAHQFSDIESRARAASQLTPSTV